MTERSYTQLFDVSYKKVEPPSEYAPDGKEFWIRVGQAFKNPKGSITVRIAAMPIDKFWPSQQLVLFPKPLDGEEEAAPAAPAPSPPEGDLMEVFYVPQGSFFKKPKGKVTYMRVGNSLNYPFNIEDLVFGVNRNGTAVQLRKGDMVKVSTLEEFLAYSS